MKDEIKVPAWLATVLVTAFVGLQGWILTEIYSLHGKFAGLAARVEILSGTQPLVKK